MKITNRTVANFIMLTFRNISIFIGLIYPFLHYLFEDDSVFLGEDSVYSVWRAMSLVLWTALIIVGAILVLTAMIDDEIQFEYEVKLPWEGGIEIDDLYYHYGKALMNGDIELSEKLYKQIEELL